MFTIYAGWFATLTFWQTLGLLPATLLLIGFTAWYMSLQHELIHARHFDDGLRLLSREKEECLTRKETALALINPVEYMHAEDLYGGEPYAMAQELGITVGVLLDYQRWLHDNLAARAA